MKTKMKLSVLEREAVSWWTSQRPLHWDEDQHLMYPCVNCTTAWEHALAKAAARKVKEASK